MPIKLGNNARAHLAAPLDADGTTIVLNVEESSSFPALSAGEWFPVTLADADGHLEIAKVTSRNGNLLAVQRGQEATAARAWLAGDRAEIRITAGVVDALQGQTDAAEDELRDELTATAAELRAEDDADQQAMNASMLLALGNLIPTGFGPVPWSRKSAPAGWLFADGRVLTAGSGFDALRDAYIADAFPYGQDGAGNPRVPDMRGRTAAGVDNMGGAAAARP